jgi:hypothetical protein
MLGRLVRGEKLPVSRFLAIENSPIRNLWRHGYIDCRLTDFGVPYGDWHVTESGRKRHAAQVPQKPVRVDVDHGFDPSYY